MTDPRAQHQRHLAIRLALLGLILLAVVMHHVTNRDTTGVRPAVHGTVSPAPEPTQ